MDRLLVIGAGIGQMPLLKKAQMRHIHVTVATCPGDYPCIEIADDVIFKDIYDRDGIVEDAKQRRITAVVSDQNDLTNPTVAFVAEKLGLPGNKYDTVMSYCNKNRFRDICEKANVPAPRHMAVNSSDLSATDIRFSLPWIVKPADSQSSIGVQIVNNAHELSDALKVAINNSPTHYAIVEEFFSGNEIVCEGFIDNGKYHLLSFADRRYFDLPGKMIPCKTLFPSSLDKRILEKIEEYERRITEFTKPSFGIVHSEYLINPENEDICIVESALRGGGVYISSDLIPMATGIDINEWLLDKALGLPVDSEEMVKHIKYAASGYICFSLPDGVIESIAGIKEIKGFPFVNKTYLNDIKIGAHTGPMTYKGARKGPILVYGNNREELERNIKKVQKALRIMVRTPSGKLEGIIWGN